MKSRSEFVKFHFSRVTPTMRTLCLISCSLIVGLVIGASLVFRMKSPEKETVSLIHNVDYFISDESFSDVHNTKATLNALAKRFLTELRSSSWLQAQQGRTNSNARPNLSSAAGLIPALERGIQEFRGSEHEWQLTSDLLRAFADVVTRDGLPLMPTRCRVM